MKTISGNNVGKETCVSSGEGEEAGGEEGISSGGTGDKLEGPGTTKSDAIHLQRRLGLFSGVALIVGTMIGIINFNT